MTDARIEHYRFDDLGEERIHAATWLARVGTWSFEVTWLYPQREGQDRQARDIRGTASAGGYESRADALAASKRVAQALAPPEVSDAPAASEAAEDEARRIMLLCMDGRAPVDHDHAACVALFEVP